MKIFATVLIVGAFLRAARYDGTKDNVKYYTKFGDFRQARKDFNSLQPKNIIDSGVGIVQWSSKKAFNNRMHHTLSEHLAKQKTRKLF